MNQSFTIRNGSFYFQDEPVRLISGAMHYFRIVPQYWQDRLRKLKDLGCNCLETYIPWNLHEKSAGKFDFSGMLDLEKYIQLAADLDLWVIIRPGPFICAEWEFGGLPAWLLKNRQLQIRCSDPDYLEPTMGYLKKILSILKPLQITKGGPVIMAQIENEYGAFGNDQSYLLTLKELYEQYLEIPLFTSDQPTQQMLTNGSVPGTITTGNFGSKAEERFSILKKFAKKQPLMCMEFWCGWFDYWGGEHKQTPALSVAKTLDDILNLNGSVNFYMFHGGTNFGYTNGANCKDGKTYEPTVTSYDYSALLSESGEITDKYLACREVIGKYIDLPALVEPPQKKYLSNPEIHLTEQAGIFNHLDKLAQPVKSVTLQTMEDVNQNYGFILYRTTVKGPLSKAELWIQDVRDRALVYVDGKYQGAIYRSQEKQKININIGELSQLDILVENMGRVNYGPFSLDRKGITQGVQINEQYLFNWQIFSLPFEKPPPIPYQKTNSITSQPAFYRGYFDVSEVQDTFINMENWCKGNVYINGFHLGRYWEIGPQKTLYLPGPLLNKGKNEFIIFELHQPKKTYISLAAQPRLGKDDR
ncbi:MAG: beta-galactosidase [Spirochaetes bacterium]|nr:beta-galactosidase [Spirochaetota bacterium]